jgi:hypothetical protein
MTANRWGRRRLSIVSATLQQLSAAGERASPETSPSTQENSSTKANPSTEAEDAADGSEEAAASSRNE